MPGKIVHIALKVKDLESSTRFYEDVFGFRQVTTHRGKERASIPGTVDARASHSQTPERLDKGWAIGRQGRAVGL
jgi:catechol 2,3-dioxygenase-like lactoylglutathione lyase family enzyme